MASLAKILGFLSTFFVFGYSLICLGLLAWYYDKWSLSKADNSDNPLFVYVNCIRADIASDVLIFISSIFGKLIYKLI